MKTRIKRLNYTPRRARRTRIAPRYEKINQRQSEGINIDKLLENSKVAVMNTDEFGNLIADPSNKLHRRWMED